MKRAFPSCQSSYERPPPGDWRKEKPFALFEPLTKQQRCVWLPFASTKYKWFYSYLTQIAVLVFVLIACSNRTINTFTLHVILKLVTNCNYSVICIVTVASKASTSAYFFPLFRASFIFVFSRSHEKRTENKNWGWSIWRVVIPYLVIQANLCSHISVFTCKT